MTGGLRNATGGGLPVAGPRRTIAQSPLLTPHQTKTQRLPVVSDAEQLADSSAETGHGRNQEVRASPQHVILQCVRPDAQVAVQFPRMR